MRICTNNWNDIKFEELFKFDNNGDKILQRRIFRYFIDKYDSFNNGLNDQLPNPNTIEQRRINKNKKAAAYENNRYHTDEQFKRRHNNYMKDLYHTVYKDIKVYCDACNKDITKAYYPVHIKSKKHKYYSSVDKSVFNN